MNVREVEKNVQYLCAKLDRELYLKTITVPASKLIFTQPFLIQNRIDYHMNQPIPAGKHMVCVVKENSNYVIVSGNCTAYTLIKKGFKKIKVRVFQHDEALKNWVGRRFYKGKQIRINLDQIKILKNSYDYHENNRKLLWFALRFMFQLQLSNENWHCEGCIIDTTKSSFVMPESTFLCDLKARIKLTQNEEPLILVKIKENQYLIIDGEERLKKPKIEAWVFTIYRDYSTIETSLKQISHEFNMNWNG